MSREHPKPDDAQLRAADCRVDDGYDESNFDNKLAFVTAGARPFVK